MVEIMVRDDLPSNSERIGKLMMAELEKLKDDSKLIGDVRGQGLMIGVDLVRDKQTKERAFEETDKLMAACLEHGLMIGKTGPVFGANGNVAKFKPAVNVTEEEAMEMVELFGRALRDVEATL
ncbi:MAG: aminotransferase class III-fold pyridoxal phosphate-dependent enzyme, partial [Vibrio fluvialis]